MNKCCKTLIWIVCAVVILVLLGVAIYFIVDDAYDKKIKTCMFKHFQSNGLLEKYNVTVDKDHSKGTFSTEDCSSIIEQGKHKTAAKIDTMAVPACIRQHIKFEYLDAMMLMGVLNKFERNGEMNEKIDMIKNSTLAAAQTKCFSATPNQS